MKTNYICKSHVTQLSKVATQLAYKQIMNHTQLLLCDKNKEKMEEAENLIYKAINILKTIE